MMEIRFAQVSVQLVESRLSEVRILMYLQARVVTLYVTLDLESSAARI